MAYSDNILPKVPGYYLLDKATITGSSLVLEAGGYAEIEISKQWLPKLTKNMLLVVHPSAFSDYYTNDAVQVTLSIITSKGSRIECLVSASQQPSGVFNTEITLPDEEYVQFTYRISSAIPVTIYNWELCAEESADVTQIIDGVEQTIPKLLYDYNTYAYAVGQREVTVGLITCFLTSGTDLQGHFTLSLYATERCNVHIRIKDNTVTELYAPLVYTVEKGFSSISIPHAYLKKKATDHAFAVTAQCTNGQLSIPVRGMLYTIDGGYLATRLLDAGIDTLDISIRQISTDLAPSEIWAIGFEGNHILLKKREYSQLQYANWTAVKDYGEGIAAAVEFNGHWINRDRSEKYTLDTEESPFVFILGTDKVLRAYYEDATVALDSNVTSISACRGFSSMTQVQQDQGLVAAYIKNGNVYYRQWLANREDAVTTWQPAATAYEGGDATFVSVHRLPDYRLGFCITYTNGTKWLISDRTYVSQAVKPEYTDVYAEAIHTVTVVDTDRSVEIEASRTASQNEFEEGPMYFSNFSVTFDYPVVLRKDKKLADLKSAIRVYVDNEEEYPSDDAISDLQIIGGAISMVLKVPVRGGRKVTIDFNFDPMAIRIYNGCYCAVTQTYEWDLPLPTTRFNCNESIDTIISSQAQIDVIPLRTVNVQCPTEELDVQTNTSVSIEAKEVTTYNISDAQETLRVSADTSASIDVTKVGDKPI